MDAAILHERLAATEGALITIDERLDALATADFAAAINAQSEQISSLEGTLTQCLERLETLQTTLTTQSSATEEAAARIAEAEAAARIAEAEAAEAMAEAIASEVEAEPEAEAGMVEEVEAEPESEGDAPASQPSPSKWWENLLTLR